MFKKLKFKLRNKLFLQFFSVLIIFVLGIMIMNSFFLEGFYLEQIKDKMQVEFNKINILSTKKNYEELEKDLQMSFQKIPHISNWLSKFKNSLIQYH